jgi:autotransporter-associated beta strand protein
MGGTTISAGTLTGTATSFGSGAINNNSRLFFDQPSDATFAANITGVGSLTKIGVGNLVLSGTNTYSGGTTISQGTLTGNTTSVGSGTIANSANLVFDEPSNSIFSGVITGNSLRATATTLAGPVYWPARLKLAMAAHLVQSPATSQTMVRSFSTGPIALCIAAVSPAQEACASLVLAP